MQGVHNFLLHNFVCVFPRFQSKTRLQSVSCSSFPSLEKKKNKNQKKKKPRREKKKKEKDHYNHILHVQLTLSFPALPASFFASSFLQPPSSNTIFIPPTFNVHPTNCNSLLSSAVFKKNTTSRHPSVIFAERGGVAY